MSEPGYPWSRGETLYADKLNEAFAETIRKTGDAMTGPLALAGDPTIALQAATKGYVDTQIAANLSGGPPVTITVSDTAPGVPTLNQLWWDSVGCNLYIWYNDGSTSQWVNATNSLTGSSIYTGDSPPVSPVTNMLWFNTADMQLYAYYYDGNSSQWVPVSNQSTGVGEAPSDGVYYSRRNNAWASPAVAPEFNRNTGRNYLDNPGFRINQRGAASVNGPAVGHPLDRWLAQFSVDTSIFQSVIATDAVRTQTGVEDIQGFLNCGINSLGAAASFTVMCQRLLDPRRLSGKTVTVSFYANASLNTCKLGVSIDQIFGTGGSPSATVTGSGTPITISGGPTWQRYSATIAVPSIIGKTLGTNGDGFTQFNFWYSAGSNHNVRSGSVGIQSGQVINIWGVQLEEGSVATPYNQLEAWEDLSRCQVYYQTGQMNDYGYNAAGAAVVRTMRTHCAMRTTPNVTTAVLGNVNLTSPSFTPIGNQQIGLTSTCTATGAYGFVGQWSASAEL